MVPNGKPSTQLWKISIMVIITAILIFSTVSCSETGAQVISNPSATEPHLLTNTYTASPESTRVSSTYTSTPIATYTIFPKTPTRTPGMFDNPVEKIEVTQGPVTVSQGAEESETYLYRNEVVSFRITAEWDVLAVAYANLDDLTNNDMENSDIEVVLDGWDGSLILSPVNNALDFVPKEREIELTGKIGDDYHENTLTEVGYSFCVDHLAEYANYWGHNFVSGDPVCVLTDEGRIALVTYVPVETTRNPDLTYNVTISVTVYQEKPELPEVLLKKMEYLLQFENSDGIYTIQ